MTIRNETIGLIINVYGQRIEPGTQMQVPEHIFDTINVHSDGGSVEITCEYGQRYIKNYGSIIAKEEEELDSEKRKVITIWESSK